MPAEFGRTGSGELGLGLRLFDLRQLGDRLSLLNRDRLGFDFEQRVLENLDTVRVGCVRFNCFRLGRDGARGGVEADEAIDIIDPRSGRAEGQQRHPAFDLAVRGLEQILEGEGFAACRDDRQPAGDAREQRRIGRVADLRDIDAALDVLADVANFGILAAADHLQQDAARPGIGNFQRVEIADRRELPVAAN